MEGCRRCIWLVYASLAITVTFLVRALFLSCVCITQLCKEQDTDIALSLCLSSYADIVLKRLNRSDSRTGCHN